MLIAKLIYTTYDQELRATCTTLPSALSVLIFGKRQPRKSGAGGLQVG